ncbi:MAG: hypothetical protein JO138_04810 [Acidobacteriaceae bacterium]|nr:hypothetical protein [Acidobacteriaceae bacterium]
MIEDERFVEEQRIKKALAPRKWAKLREDLQNECEQTRNASSVSIRLESPAANEAKLRNLESGAMALLTYVPDVPCIFYESPKRHGQIVFRLSSDRASLQFVENGAPQHDSEIVQNLMIDVLR